jgi:hypothetical protein
LLIEPLAAAVLVIVAVWLLPHPAPRMPAAANGSALLMIRSTGVAGVILAATTGTIAIGVVVLLALLDLRF